MKIVPSNRAGPHAQGAIHGYSANEIAKILGFDANIEDDPYKVKYSWGFTVDGRYGAIWDFKGSHKYKQFSTYGPQDIFDKLFPEK